MKILCAGKSVKGEDHECNEDSLLVEPKLRIFAVADGVSIPEGGKEASEKVLKYLKEFFKGNLKEAIEKVNQVFIEEKIKKISKGFTTISAVHFKRDSVEICNVGDSIVFLVRDGKIETLSLIDKLPGTSILTQAIGERLVKVHESKKKLKSGDLIILTTDGITDVLNELEILEEVKREDDVEKIVENLIKKAERKISAYNDDKTLIVVKVVDWRSKS
ncbi:MAG: serine/threonine-protein phosphatase [Candidatus Aenigmatarchaeota archaeon]